MWRACVWQMAGFSGKRDCFGNAARCAVEIAVLDAFLPEAGAATIKRHGRRFPETLAIRQKTVARTVQRRVDAVREPFAVPRFVGMLEVEALRVSNRGR